MSSYLYECRQCGEAFTRATGEFRPECPGCGSRDTYIWARNEGAGEEDGEGYLECGWEGED